jgi:hypothetical protein
MALSDNERIQEAVLMAQEKSQAIGKKVWYGLGLTIVLIVPVYYVLKFGFVTLLMQTYREPKIIYTEAIKEPLQVLETKFFKLTDNTYSGYVKIKNLNLEWGVKSQTYTAEFKTVGGTVLTKAQGTTYILPASEKIIVFSRFTANQTPYEVIFKLGETQFTHKPEIDVDLGLERTTISYPSSGMIVYAGVKNNTPYTLKQINLPMVVYDNTNKIVGVNYTFINDVLSNETRTFQYSWPAKINGAARAEIYPEVNIFDSEVFEVPPGESPINGRDE